MDFKKSSVSIEDYCSKVKKLKITDVTELNLIVDQLNALNYFDFSKENEVYEELLCGLAKLISPGNDHMLSKFCCLIYHSLHKQKIILHNSSFDYLMKFTISAIYSCMEWVQSDVLMALSALIEINGDHIKKFNDGLLGKNGVLTNFSVTDNKNIQYNTFQCLLSLLKSTDENSLPQEILDFCFQRCLLVLKDKSVCNASDILTLKVVITSLKCLQLIFASKSLKMENFGELLGILKNLLFYGLPGQTFTMDTNLYPTLRYPEASHHQESQSESDSPYPKLRKQKKNKRRLKKTSQKKQTDNTPTVEDESNNVTDGVSDGIANVSLTSSNKVAYETKIRSSSSDSELSDAESHISKIRSLQASLRQNAYLALQNVIKVSDKKVMFGYWSYFLPEHPVILGLVSSPNIFTTILKDPASQVRLSALTLLAEILRGSKQFLIHADGRNVRHLSFTSLSSILATMISEIHRYLLLALLSENSSLILIQILKCYAILIENVPYCKLNTDILLKFLKHIKNCFSHKDIQVQVACIAVFCSVVNSDQIPAEIEELIISPDFENAMSALKANASVDASDSLNCPRNESPWIIEICKNNILDDEPLPVKIQSLQLLSSIVGKYFQKSLGFFTVIENIVLFCLDNPDTAMKLHGAKLLDILGRGMNLVTDVQLRRTLQPLVSTLWQKVLTEPFMTNMLNDDAKTLQSVCCDCLSTLPSEDFEKLPPRQQVLYMTILLGLASDPNPNVRGAAIRCLGLWCLFPSLNQDTSFPDDVSVILIKSVKDPNVNVRFKASWSLGNLSDALFVNKDKFLISKEIPAKFFCSVGMACVEFSKDCDRVKANAVRALGNLLNYIPEEYTSLNEIQKFAEESCEVLKSALSSNFMKVCWNSCYALGHMLRNIYLVEHCNLNLDELLNCLLKVLKSPNFKVRISAAQALTALTSRKLYGKILPIIWKQLVSALFSTSSDVNFKEIKHQENLCDQLCFSICQLAVLMTPGDISEITNETIEAREMLLISMWKFGSRMSQDKSAIVRQSVNVINSMKNAKILSDADSTLTVLFDILNQVNIAFNDQMDAENTCTKTILQA